MYDAELESGNITQEDHDWIIEINNSAADYARVFYDVISTAIDAKDAIKKINSGYTNLKKNFSGKNATRISTWAKLRNPFKKMLSGVGGGYTAFKDSTSNWSDADKVEFQLLISQTTDDFLNSYFGPEAVPAPTIETLTVITAAKVGITTTFNITGTNLPATAPLDITFNGCANIQFVSQSAAQHQFTCTPTVAGTLTAVIRTLPGTTPLGSFPVVVSAASTATSCANPVTNTLFSEKFASPLNANVWSVDTDGGTVASTIGKLTVSGQGYRFPYIQTLDNPFPASENYSFYCKENYLNFGPNGTGACIASQTVIPPGSANYAYEAGTLFQWWGDSGQRYITTASTSNSGHSLLFEASIDTGVGTHELETCVIGSTITTYKDGIQIGTATLPTGYMRPTRIWIGNPANGSSFLPWTSFETHKIEVRQLQ